MDKDQLSDDMMPIVQMMEQLTGMLRHQATTMAGYYKQLRQEGVPDDTARALVVDMQQTLWSSVRFANRSPQNDE